jgi:cytoskeletal protein CcmA (bactofilin family)
MVWGKKNGTTDRTDRNDHSGAEELENVLGPSSSVRGDLKAEGGFRIDGKVEGNVESAGPVIIGDAGQVRGNVQGTDVVVVGRVEGNITASRHLDIGAKGKVIGDVTAKSMRIETGGVFRGTSFMGESESDPVVTATVTVAAPN